MLYIKHCLRLTTLVVSLLIAGHAWSQNKKTSFDRTEFYTVLSGNNLNQVNTELHLLSAVSFVQRGAFEGALTMKKAAIVKGASKKLALFKTGRQKLESAIRNDSSNGELRFLRLIIQEHAPSMLNYNNSLQNDSRFVTQTYKSLPESVQKIIIDYSKKSKVLKLQDS